MLRDLKFLRRNTGKNNNVEEIENVPINPNESNSDSISNNPTNSDTSKRGPLHGVQESAKKTKLSSVEQEVSVKSKFDRTPTKPKGKNQTTTLLLRTPERQGNGNVGKNRFGFSSLNECRDEGRSEMPNYLSQSSRPGNSSLNLTPRVAGAALGRDNSTQSECTSTQSTPTKSVSKPPNPGFAPFSSSRHHGSARGGTYSALSRRFSVAGGHGQPCVVNTAEVPHFDLKEDPSFWMDHNVQVILRVRPLNTFERSTHGYNRCVKQDGAQSITWVGQPETRFTFDHVACETVDQEMLFRTAALPMVENCLSGYNSCMFAYGQTGSGKTYTMLGEMDNLEFKPSPHRGMTPRIFEFLFARIRAEEESRRDERLKYSCKCSFLEIYNEQITDLLDPSSSNLLLREDVKKGVYVENLSEFEVHTVGDVLRLLIQGSSNRKVAATNMNRESSRSHSVFTCVIECKWERESTTNLRFARLNLVDLAGSERQKSSGAEGERLKEAANINKSLSTLGHVIMLLVDIAHGKPRHVPYRDSRLTFLLQDSLGGNSKTMIIANISPSICCAAETLNTLKFAQRAKLIQNNAVVNEDSSGDVAALQHQIWLLKEELSALKRQTVSRTLAFDPSSTKRGQESIETDNRSEKHQPAADDMLNSDTKGSVRVSSQQLKSLESMLAGALRREQMAETSIRQLEAEIEQLNRLVSQREEDTRCTKMMLKFREEKIHRMESLLGDLKPVDAYLLEENAALSEENKMLRAKIEKNPEVTRFALENIRLLEQLRRFQDFYEEGERDILMSEVSHLRGQLIHFLDNSNQLHGHTNMAQDAESNVEENQSLHSELTNTLNELAECRSKLKSCLDSNAKLNREIEDLHALLRNNEREIIMHCDIGDSMKKEVEYPSLGAQPFGAEKEEKHRIRHGPVVTHAEEVLNLELELDILKIILKEERLSRGKIEEMASCLTRDVQSAEERILKISKQCEDAKRDLTEAKAVIEALESQQLLSINEIEDLKNLNSHHLELLRKQELEISALKEQTRGQEATYSSLKHSQCEDSSLQVQLRRMQASLDKAKRLNKSYQCDHASQLSNEEEMEEICRQAEAETAEVIVCLQEELSMLQQQVQAAELREKGEEKRLLDLETKRRELQETLYMMSQDNEALQQNLQEKDTEMSLLREDWELLTCEIEEALIEGHEALRTASDQLNPVSDPPSNRRDWISEQFGIMIKLISDKEALIEELNRCLEDANSKTNELEHMLISLRGAAMVMTESHEQECYEKEKEIVQLRSELSRNVSAIGELENRMKIGHAQMRNTSDCATAAFVVVNRLSELNSSHLDALRVMDIQLKETQEANRKKDVRLDDQATAFEAAQKQIDTLGKELQVSEANCTMLSHQLDERQRHMSIMQRQIEENDEISIANTKQTLDDLKTGVSDVRSSINEYVEQVGCHERPSQRISSVDGFRADRVSSPLSGNQAEQETTKPGAGFDEDLEAVDSSAALNTPYKGQKDISVSKYNDLPSMKSSSDRGRRDVTISLLKKEMESAMQSLKEVQAEMVRLSAEKEEIYKSEKKSREGTETVKAQVLSLQAALNDFERRCENKVLDLNHKLQKVEGDAQEAKRSWWKTRESLELEAVDAKASAAQKSVEASCLLARFEEAQDMIKEADLMINGLMIANETMKLEVEDLSKMNDTLTGERDGLIVEVQGLRSSNELKDQKCKSLENQLELDVSETKILTEEIERLAALVQDSSEDASMSFGHELSCMKSELQDTVKFMHSSLEEIWSEILMKDCALSVLHLCHMGVMLEAVTGLNAENGLLHHGICESNAVISNLREHNLKSKEELEMCRMLKGKLLADIKHSFDRILSKEGETTELSMKLSSFNEKLRALQHQEEMMLERSNIMSSELAFLMEEVDKSNSTVMASLSEQEKLLKSNEEVIKSEAETSAEALFSKDLELLIVASELKQLAHHHANMEKEQIICCSALDYLMKDIVTLRITVDLTEEMLLEREKEMLCLQKEVTKAKDSEARMLSQFQTLEAERNSLREYLTSKEEENESLQNKVEELKSENCSLLEDYQVIDSEFKSSAGCIDALKLQNGKLQESVATLESRISFLQKDLEMKNAELDEYQSSQVSTTEALSKRSQDLESYVLKINELKEENLMLAHELQSLKKRETEALKNSSSRFAKCVGSTEAADLQRCRMLKQLDKNIIMVTDQISQDHCINLDVLSNFFQELEFVEAKVKRLADENLSLQEELLRKDEVLNGLLFDLRLLQESAVSSKDQKDDIEELSAALDSTEQELAVRSQEFDEAVAYGETLEAKLKEQGDVLSALEMEFEKTNQSAKLLSDENLELRSQVEEITAAKTDLDRELIEKRSIIDGLENELLQMGNTLGQMNEFVESLKSNLDDVISERDDLQKELVILEEKVETAHVLAEENEAIAAEAQEVAESRRIYAEEKEEEVKLLETSVQELDSTISVLENKVDILKGEAERQKLQREELELELQSLKNQMLNVESSDADMKRHLDEKSRNLQEALKQIKILEKDLANKDKEIAQCKAHITELTVHAEAQACEYKQKFKELESMLEQLKADEALNHDKITSSNKLEKNASKGRGSASPFKAKGSGSPFKARGSGSPFKCIGLGLSHQLKSERDEELNAERLRIEELEALAASRQKEIFMLNSRLAAAESMTHDVIRDLLGVKMDMSNYVTLLDKQQVQKITEKAQFDVKESQDQEVKKIKHQLNDFVEERQGWLEEIDRRQAELVAAQIALEKHRQQEQLLASENEVLKMENAKHKQRVIELEGEVKKLSGQQNLHQRIHHHAKIKEENNVLKIQNEDLTSRLRRAESYLTRVRDELAHYRACGGRSPFVNLDEEQRLSNKLREMEKEKVHLAQTLLSLCTSILKAAGVTRPTSEINLSAAEEALEQLCTHVISLERELEDLKVKNRIANERLRLAELMPEDHRQTPPPRSRRASQAPFFSALDR